MIIITATLILSIVTMSMSDEFSDLKSNIAVLAHRVTVLESQLEVAKSKMTRADIIREQLQLAQDHQSAILKKLVSDNTRKVAFFGMLADGNHGPNVSLKWDKIVTNIGNSYNKHSGIFTAHLAGIYSFHVNVLGAGDKYVKLQIYVNGKEVVIAFGGIHGAASQSLVLKMNKGDSIWVVLSDYAHYAIDRHGDHSSFSGYLLY